MIMLHFDSGFGFVRRVPVRWTAQQWRPRITTSLQAASKLAVATNRGQRPMAVPRTVRMFRQTSRPVPRRTVGYARSLTVNFAEHSGPRSNLRPNL